MEEKKSKYQIFIEDLNTIVGNTRGEKLEAIKKKLYEKKIQKFSPVKTTSGNTRLKSDEKIKRFKRSRTKGLLLKKVCKWGKRKGQSTDKNSKWFETCPMFWHARVPNKEEEKENPFCQSMCVESCSKLNKSTDEKKDLLRNIARSYLFVCPTVEMLEKLETFCNYFGVKLVPEIMAFSGYDTFDVDDEEKDTGAPLKFNTLNFFPEEQIQLIDVFKHVNCQYLLIRYAFHGGLCHQSITDIAKLNGTQKEIITKILIVDDGMNQDGRKLNYNNIIFNCAVQQIESWNRNKRVTADGMLKACRDSFNRVTDENTMSQPYSEINLPTLNRSLHFDPIQELYHREEKLRYKLTPP